MKVLGVSFKSLNSNINDSNRCKNYATTVNQHFLYQPKPKEKKPLAEKIFLASLLSIAAIAVGITLKNIGTFKKRPLSITDLPNSKFGLNKLDGYEKNIETIKKDILYPLCIISKKEEEALNLSKVKSGAIISGESADELNNFMDALVEHAEKLNISVINIKGKNRNNKAKSLYKTIRHARKLLEQDKKPLIINLGNLADYTELRINKSRMSKVEKALSEINPKDDLGIVWITWTDKPKSIPCFFNNLPVVITKLNK